MSETITGDSGSIKYPEEGFYDDNLNCYFKIIVEEGKKVKISFDQFNFARGYDYNIGLATTDSQKISKKYIPGKKGKN